MTDDREHVALYRIKKGHLMAAGHAHQYDTNGDWYRCPLRNCWWNDPASHVHAERAHA